MRDTTKGQRKLHTYISCCSTFCSRSQLGTHLEASKRAFDLTQEIRAASGRLLAVTGGAYAVGCSPKSHASPIVIRRHMDCFLSPRNRRFRFPGRLLVFPQVCDLGHLTPVGSAVVVAAAALDPTAFYVYLISGRWHGPVTGGPDVLSSGPFPVARDPYGIRVGLSDNDFGRCGIRRVDRDGCQRLSIYGAVLVVDRVSDGSTGDGSYDSPD
jgi:hypothetical protein